MKPNIAIICVIYMTDVTEHVLFVSERALASLISIWFVWSSDMLNAYLQLSSWSPDGLHLQWPTIHLLSSLNTPNRFPTPKKFKVGPLSYCLLFPPFTWTTPS